MGAGKQLRRTMSPPATVERRAKSSALSTELEATPSSVCVIALRLPLSFGCDVTPFLRPSVSQSALSARVRLCPPASLSIPLDAAGLAPCQ